MKNTVIIIIYCFFCSNTIIAQINCIQDSTMYIAAYNYIASDSLNRGKSIVVSDSIVDLDRFWFSKDLTEFTVEREKLDHYRLSKNYVWFDSFYSQCISSLFSGKNLNSKMVLFFSIIEDNMLRADLLPHNKKWKNKFNYNTMSFQNVGQIYLFIFNKDGSIKKVFSHEIIYD